MPPETAFVRDDVPVAERRDLTFTVAGDACAAWHLPAVGVAPGATRPCVVMAHGFSMVRDARLMPYAERFAQAGADVLVFDYRCFGDSEGQPRQWMDVPRQLEDWRAAIAFARSGALPGVDPERLALWGTSFSGGHVAALASEDERLAATISQVPFSGLGGRPKDAPRRVGHQLRMVRAALADRVSAALGRGPRLIAVVGDPGEFAAFNLRGAKDQLGVLLDDGTTWRNEFTPRVILQMGSYKPFEHPERIGAPWLLAVCDPDSITPAAVAVERAQGAPKLTVTHHPYEHFEVYRGAPFEALVAEQVAFLREHLLAT